MIVEKYCANCANLVFWNTPYPHFWCDKNKNCPCNYDETADYEFFCEKYKDVENKTGIAERC